MSEARSKHYRSFLEPASRDVDSYVHLSYDVREPAEDRWAFRQIDLKISDCTRSATLSFGYMNAKGKRNMYIKALKLREFIDRAIAELED